MNANQVETRSKPVSLTRVSCACERGARHWNWVLGVDQLRFRVLGEQNDTKIGNGLRNRLIDSDRPLMYRRVRVAHVLPFCQKVVIPWVGLFVDETLL